MTELQFPFTKRGFLHELECRANDTCLVRRSKGGIYHYEVVVLLHAPERTLPNGKTLPERETYPSSETWGVYGFTFPSTQSRRARLKYFAVARKQGSKDKSDIMQKTQ